MDLRDTSEQARYRARVRSWIEMHLSDAPPSRPARAIAEDASYRQARAVWQGKLAQAGLVGVTWPSEYGGQGLGPIEQVIVNQEIARAGVPGPLDVIGLGLIGPCLIAHGTDAQKARYLEPMLRGEEVWCQLFSEPAAGSDLAAVETRAQHRHERGSWLINGQKVWTTNAQFASFGLLLARTDPNVPKHKGLSMFIIPMDAPGVTVRGLRQISGEAEFNEVFLEDLEVGSDSVVGGLGNGWATALTVLMYERLTFGIDADVLGFSPERFAGVLAGSAQAAADVAVRQEFGRAAAELLAVRFFGYRMLTALERGQIPGPEAGLAKITLVNATGAVCHVLVDALGPDALADDSELVYLISLLPGLRIAGGTEQILRTTVGERVLGLPPEPRIDKQLSFTEFRRIRKEALGA